MNIISIANTTASINVYVDIYLFVMFYSLS